jgi:protein O-GlcNAc transferase
MNGPWMHDSEILLILKHLYYTDTMLEWGSGGSTLYFPHFVQNYHSIEHDREWHNAITKQLESYQYKVDYHYVDRDLPHTRPATYEQYKSYIEHIHKIGVKTFDKVLVDGRARGWCAEIALQYLHKDSIVFIHDFWNRTPYHVVFKWYDELDSIKTPGLQTIVALKPKPEFVGENRIKTPIEL